LINIFNYFVNFILVKNNKKVLFKYNMAFLIMF
jgi:hypothetical protein